jgi:hypothetical protein
MTGLDFVMEPLFECPDDDAGDAAFVKATRTIGGRDAIEEYMACGFFPLSASFGLGEVGNGETAVSKLAVPMPMFSVARLPEETNDGFRGRVELVTANIVGRYARGEHDVCVAALPNGGRVNRVFEQAGVSYGPRLKPGSEASKVVALKRKSDVGAGHVGKCVKVSNRKMVSSKAHAELKSVGAASSKAALPKATLAKSTPKTSVAARVGDLPKPRPPLGTIVPKITAMIIAPRAGVLKISTGTKRPAIALLPTARWK